jgi:hypothetical protein
LPGAPEMFGLFCPIQLPQNCTLLAIANGPPVSDFQVDSSKRTGGIAGPTFFLRERERDYQLSEPSLTRPARRRTGIWVQYPLARTRNWASYAEAAEYSSFSVHFQRMMFLVSVSCISFRVVKRRTNSSISSSEFLVYSPGFESRLLVEVWRQLFCCYTIDRASLPEWRIFAISYRDNR